jgi:hypothetical protein
MHGSSLCNRVIRVSAATSRKFFEGGGMGGGMGGGGRQGGAFMHFQPAGMEVHARHAGYENFFPMRPAYAGYADHQQEDMDEARERLENTTVFVGNLDPSVRARVAGGKAGGEGLTRAGGVGGR